MRIACVAAALASRGIATRMVSCVQTPTPPLRRRGGVGGSVYRLREWRVRRQTPTRKKQFRQLRRLL